MEMELMSFMLILWIGLVNAQISLRHLDTAYLPRCFKDCSSQYVFKTGSAEQIVFDENGPYIYAVGEKLIHVFDYSTPTNLKRVAYHQFGTNNSLEATDVEACGDFIAVSLDNKANSHQGKVLIMRRYNPHDSEKIPILHDIPVGVMPDMIKFTKDCSKLLVAVGGELHADSSRRVYDPEGAVAIITFDHSTATLQMADFTVFNVRAEEYVTRGVRWVFKGQEVGIENSFSQDLEPGSIAISHDDTVAYVTLQENNAIAVLDIPTTTFTEIYPLSTLSWQDSALDASDKDGGINLAPWRIMGLSQPEGIKLITIKGVEYLLTANEGDSKEYEEPEFPFTWSELKSGSEFTSEELNVDSELIYQLKKDNGLGRLELSTIDGKNEEGKYETLYSYGQRSFSLYKTSNFSLVYNSGGEFEEKISYYYPTIFNSQTEEEGFTPEESFDTGSHKNGPAPKSIETGIIDGTTVVFVGIGKPGFIAIYSLDDSGETPTFNFQSLSYGGGFGRPWEELYADRIARDLDPEDIRFISGNAPNNPTDMNMIAVVGSDSGTLSLYEVVMRREVDKPAVNDVITTAGRGEVSVGALLGVSGAFLLIVVIALGWAIGTEERYFSHKIKNKKVKSAWNKHDS